MKELSLEHKNAIRDALSAYCDNYLSRNRAAESLNGVSAATKGAWDCISKISF